MQGENKVCRVRGWEGGHLREGLHGVQVGLDDLLEDLRVDLGAELRLGEVEEAGGGRHLGAGSQYQVFHAIMLVTNTEQKVKLKELSC